MDQDQQGRRGSELGIDAIQTRADLVLVLQRLRNRHGREHNYGPRLTYRQIAEKTGYPHSSIGAYFKGTTLPPAEKLDGIARILGATAEEQGLFATKRDHIEEREAGQVEPPRVVPRQLPAANRHFTGRTTELAELTTLLERHRGEPNAVVIAAIEGTPGVGKTALTVTWCHRVADQFPDGQLYVNLRDVGQEQAVAKFLRALGVPPPPLGVVVSLAEQVDLYRSLLAERRILVVLDNATDADQVRPLLPGSASCFAVVASRSQLTGLIVEGAHPLLLSPLDADHAYDLLVRYLGAERVHRESQAASRLVALCARLPLALTVVAARAAVRKTAQLQTFCDELAERGIDALTTGDETTSVEAVFSWSYDHLSEPAQRMFRLLGIHPGPDLSLPAAASLAAVSLDAAESALAELVHTHLLEQDGHGRFGCHDLLRDYAGKRANRVDPAGARSAERRLLDHYLHTAYAAAANFYPRQLNLLPAQPGVMPESITTIEDAVAWFDAEATVLSALTAQAGDHGFDVHAWQIPWTLADFLDRQGRWDDLVATHQVAVIAVRRLGDQLGLARTLGNLGRAYRRLGRYPDAFAANTTTLGIFEALSDTGRQALVHRSIAHLLEDQHDYAAALRHSQQALRLAGDDPLGRAGALNQVGWFHALLGRPEQTLLACQEAVELYRDLDSVQHDRAAAWDSIGVARHALGDHAAAITAFHRAIELFEAAGDLYKKAETLIRLSAAHHAIGHSVAACDTRGQARKILNGMYHIDAERTIHDILDQFGSA